MPASPSHASTSDAHAGTPDCNSCSVAEAGHACMRRKRMQRRSTHAVRVHAGASIALQPATTRVQREHDHSRWHRGRNPAPCFKASPVVGSGLQSGHAWALCIYSCGLAHRPGHAAATPVQTWTCWRNAV
eukprot:358308-Chlamydomonas_euryale.AAC.13